MKIYVASSWRNDCQPDVVRGLRDLGHEVYDFKNSLTSTTPMAAMEWSQGCVLVMPCGRSAHLEAGWFVGKEKPLWILKDRGEPELMYEMANGILTGLGPLLLAIQGWEQTLAETQDFAAEEAQRRAQ